MNGRIRTPGYTGLMLTSRALWTRLSAAAKADARLNIGVIGLYTLLATVLCGSVLPNPAHLALGHPGNDVWNHVWGYWWVAHALGQGDLPIRTELLGWPNGGSLWFIDFFNAVLTLPVQWIAGPVAAYNFSIWFNLILCGVGAYALARRVTDSFEGAVLAGAAYLTAPHLLAQVYNGISETVSAGWLPLALLALRDAFHHPRASKGAIAGAMIAVTAVANWYYGLFAGIVLSGLILRALARALPRAGARAPNRRTLQSAATAASALLAGTVTAAGIAAVPFGLFAQSMGAADALVTRDPGFVWITLVMHNMTDVLALVHPGKYYSPDLHAAFGEDLIVVVYLGAALLFPACLLYFTPLVRQVESWLALLVAFLVLTLGPFLFIDGSYVNVQGGWIPLPFLLLFEWFPMFSRISHAYRFVVGVTLALCVLAAFAVKIAPRYGISARRAAIAIGAARIIEALWLSPAVFPIPASPVEVPAIYKQLTDGAVLDLPITMPVLARSKLLVNQIVHGQPVPFGLNDPVPKFLHNNHYSHYIVALERRSAMFLPPEIPDIDLAAGQAQLVALGCRWIVVHRDSYTADQYIRVAHFLDITARAVSDDGALRVYDLLPDPAAPIP